MESLLGETHAALSGDPGEHPTSVDLVQPGEAAEESRLAGSIGADETPELTGWNREVDAVEDPA
jgi:hypothetical protein